MAESVAEWPEHANAGKDSPLERALADEELTSVLKNFRPRWPRDAVQAR